MNDIEPVGLGHIAHTGGQTYAAALGPGADEVTLFCEEPREGFEQTGGYWRRRVRRAELDWLVLLRTVGAFGGEPCVVLDEDDDGLHIAYTGHSGLKAEALGYWMVDHGAYEVVVPHDEVHSIRVERVSIPCQPSRDPSVSQV
ncbi:hypothetical protein Sru01_37340 [Sphaerisporangium rufum]|uniref:Uncharacterized protein n=1 Tax=Sphaerisporangium rufum TaxID=1381558 RepID=A0A919R311_9ACTN|nr:hypothetical protein [Sphaerisporangium rufum]GII78752.1 hypothetical protein Sru01_37340 [Sphaerisporangium rufum]